MMDDKGTTLQEVVQFALPLGTSLLAGSPDIQITWAVTVRAQPPAFPDISAGELALVAMDILRSYDSRITLAEVIQSLAQEGVSAVAAAGNVEQTAVAVAGEYNVGLLALPQDTGLASVERAVNKLIANQGAQLTQRAMEIQRQLTALAAENRDLNSLLSIMAKAAARPIVVHDDAGVLIAQSYPSVSRRGSGRSLLQNLPYEAFQNWLNRDAPTAAGVVVESPIGFTTVLKVEKRVAGYLSLVDQDQVLGEFDRLVLTNGADVCAIELAKTRAIASAVEQTRGDWIQMWLSGTQADDDLLTTRAAQAGFSPDARYVVVVFRAITQAGASLPLESLISLVRDDMTRRGVNGAVGQYVDVIVALYPVDDDEQSTARVRQNVETVRDQLATRASSGIVAAGISRPTSGLGRLRDAYREARDAISIAYELDERESTTYFGDLKLYQLLLALKERNLEHLRRFYDESLRPLAEHDQRKGGDLVRTLDGFFQANGNLAKAAGDLDVHRNTLVYRLERISEMTGLDLDDAENRLILHLALKIQRVLATLPETAQLEDDAPSG